MPIIDAEWLLNQLERCPNCGAEPVVSPREDGWKVYCPDCGCNKREHYVSIGEVIKGWNRREEECSSI